ncbi:MAG: cytochrome d ubiquinol oxidase subunit II [Actinomycetaceae bacterium]|nr:cytochrome d ubiquinol oxidase subunit II [Actinomycetaceae bacterium]
MYTVLQIVWFILIAVLWTGYLVLEGFGVGAGMIMPIVAKTDRERSQVQRTYGPVWDGNEVWLLTAGGATFAAFPLWYATMFSGMYLALFLILVCLIVRICAIEWRSKVASEKWRAKWDWGQIIATWLVPILFGVAFANLVQGMNIAVVDPATPQKSIAPDTLAALPNKEAMIHNFVGEGAPLESVFLSLLTPYTILGGVALMCVFLAQGSLWLSIKTDGVVQERAKNLAKSTTVAATLTIAVLAVWGQFAYASQVLWGWIPLVIAALAIIGATALTWLDKPWLAFFTHGAAIAGAVSWIFTTMAPNVMKSSIDPDYSLTMWEASSSESTLIVMLVVAVLLVPVVLGYTAWAYTKMSGTISVHDVEDNPGLVWDRIQSASNVSGNFFKES